MILTQIPAKKKNDVYLVITDAYREKGKVKRRTVKKIGYLSELEKEYSDPISHFKEEAKRMAEEKKKYGGIQNLKIDFSLPAKDSVNYKFGNLIINEIIKSFKLEYIFRKERDNSKLRINLNKIFQYLIAKQILEPSSKLKSFEDQERYFGINKLNLHDIYRALGYFNTLSPAIQIKIGEETKATYSRDFSTTYYDCTNYYFEIDIEDDFRKYGFSKEHRPNPLVQMGLFSDKDGIPLAFDIFNGSQNEQKSMIPIEKEIITNITNSHLIVCADAGLCSANNKYFNTIKGKRDYIFVQSLKKVKEYLEDEIFSEENDKRVIISPTFKYYQRPINDKIKVTLFGETIEPIHEAKIIVTYDEDFANYLRFVRNKRIEKAKAIIASPSKYNKETSKDGKQYIKDVKYDKNGQIVSTKLFLDQEKIDYEEKYDGYYALITSLVDENPLKIISINKQRREIEDCFRTLKSYLKARPVYLSKEERINGHFLLNFVALTVLKLIQKKLRETKSREETTIPKIINALRELEITEIAENIYANGNVSALSSEIMNLYKLNLNKKFLKKINLMSD